MWIKAENSEQDILFVNLSQAHLLYIERTGLLGPNQWSLRVSFGNLLIYNIKRFNSKEEAEAVRGSIMAQLNVFQITER